MRDKPPFYASQTLFIAAIVASLVAKVLLSQVGHNFDVDSSAIAADIVLKGKAVYAETGRYNYGPLWCYVVALFRWLDRHSPVVGPESFHGWLAFFLAAVDVGIAAVLRRTVSASAGLVFLLNPVSLFITGFHSQFDNLAILLALAAAAVAQERQAPGRAWGPASIGLLSASLIVKHDCIMLPLWLVLRPGLSWRARAGQLLPVVFFFASFLPFMFDPVSRHAVVENVFHYGADPKMAFYPQLLRLALPLPGLVALFNHLPLIDGTKAIFLLSLGVAGVLFRREGPVTLVLLYSMAIVVFASGLSDQALVVPVAACAAYWRSLSARLYLMLVTCWLLSPMSNDVGGYKLMLTGIGNLARLSGVAGWQGPFWLMVFLGVKVLRTTDWRQPREFAAVGELKTNASEL